MTTVFKPKTSCCKYVQCILHSDNFCGSGLTGKITVKSLLVSKGTSCCVRHLKLHELHIVEHLSETVQDIIHHKRRSCKFSFSSYKARKRRCKLWVREGLKNWCNFTVFSHWNRNLKIKETSEPIYINLHVMKYGINAVK